MVVNKSSSSIWTYRRLRKSNWNYSHHPSCRNNDVLHAVCSTWWMFRGDKQFFLTLQMLKPYLRKKLSVWNNNF